MESSEDTVFRRLSQPCCSVTDSYWAWTSRKGKQKGDMAGERSLLIVLPIIRADIPETFGHRLFTFQLQGSACKSAVSWLFNILNSNMKWCIFSVNDDNDEVLHDTCVWYKGYQGGTWCVYLYQSCHILYQLFMDKFIVNYEKLEAEESRNWEIACSMCCFVALWEFPGRELCFQEER